MSKHVPHVRASPVHDGRTVQQLNLLRPIYSLHHGCHGEGTCKHRTQLHLHTILIFIYPSPQLVALLNIGRQPYDGWSFHICYSKSQSNFLHATKSSRKSASCNMCTRREGGGEVPLSKQNGHSRNRAARTKRMVSSSMDSWRESGSG
jgi:hypothetical protein